MVVGTEDSLVYAQNYGLDVVGLCRGAEAHLLGAGLKVQLKLLFAGKDSGRLDHEVHTQLAPWKLCRVLDGGNANLFAVDDQAVWRMRNRALESAVCRVVLEQVRQGGGVGQVVDGYNLNVGTYDEVAKGEAADAAKSVDSDLIHSEYKKTSKKS